MKATIALVRREFLEHRGAFLYAPAVLVGVMFILVAGAAMFGNRPMEGIHSTEFSGTLLFQLALGAIYSGWSLYLMIALFFYFSDSFSVDRRNNSLLFWKSMPQSDLKVLSSKALAGVTIFPALILFFAMLSGLLVYVLGVLISARLPFIPLAGPVDMVTSWLMFAVTGLVFFILSIAWYAPFLALVAGLSTIFQRWSIPLAILSLGVPLLVELIFTAGRPGASTPIHAYLALRGQSVLENVDVVGQITHAGSLGPLVLIGDMLGNIDWIQMILGLVFAGAMIFIASEYRRRRIDG